MTNLFEVDKVTAPFAVVLLAFNGEAIGAPNKSVQVALSFEPCTIKLAAVAAKICVADNLST